MVFNQLKPKLILAAKNLFYIKSNKDLLIISDHISQAENTGHMSDDSFFFFFLILPENGN